MKVYISYSRRDAIAANAIVAAVRKAGHEALFDRDQLTTGVDFSVAIEKMIDEADVVLVVWSPAAVESRYIQAEALKALELSKYIGFSLGEVTLSVPFNVYHHQALRPDGSEPSAGMIASALDAVGGQHSTRQSANRSAQYARRQRTPPPPPLRAESYPPVDEQLDIPAFLRRQPDPMPETPAAETAVPAIATPPAAIASGERTYDVFISYSRKDTKACVLAFNLMTERSVEPWYDKDVGGGSFKQTIVTRISQAPVFVLLLSRNSVGSPNVRKELSIAADAGCLIIPVSIDGIAAGDLADTFRFELIELNIFTADPTDPESWSEVIKTVVERVAQIRTQAGGAQPIAAPMALMAKASKPRRPVFFAVITVVSALLQQAAVGVVLWTSGAAGMELAVAAAVACATG